MNTKLLVAGAIIVLVVACGVAAAALSFQGQASPETCIVSGYVMSTLGQGLPGLTVTLHVMGDTTDGQVREIYNLTTLTNDTPAEGQYVFDNVTIPDGAKYAYVETSKKVGDITSYGRSNNYTLKANENMAMSIVLKLPPTPGEMPGLPDGCRVNGTVVDSRGVALSGVNTTLHLLGKNSSTGVVEEVYNMTLVSAPAPSAGTVVFDVYMPDGVDHAYLESVIEKDGITYLGRSDNLTLAANGTVNAAVVMHVPP